MSTQTYAGDPRAEDLAFLVAHGETPDNAAARLGVTRETLERWCHRKNLHDLWAELTANETPIRKAD